MRTILTGANLVDGESPPRPGHTVVVDGDRIASVGPDGSVAARPDDRVVDLAGRTVMPGMASCHVHSTYHRLGATPAPMGLEEPPALAAVRAVNSLGLLLEHGFTSAVSAGAPHAIDPAMKLAIDHGLVPGPRFVPGSRDLSTTGHANDLSHPWSWRLGSEGGIRRCDGADEFRRAARTEIKEGAEILKLFVTGGHGTTSPKERLEMTGAEMGAAIEAAHARGARVRGHIANREALHLALDLGIDVVDHGDGLDDEGIERLAESGTALVPSVFFPYTFHRAMADGGLGFTDEMAHDIDQMAEVLPRANAAGVRIVLGDDYGAMTFPHRMCGEELAFYADVVGIPALDVIRWATRNGAELAAGDDSVGTVAEGKLADLLVVDGDPVADLSLLADPANLLAVVKGGAFATDRLDRLEALALAD